MRLPEGVCLPEGPGMIRLPSPEKCPKCGKAENEIIRTRIADAGFRYRRRKCHHCKKRWNTYETMLNPRYFRPAAPKPPAPPKENPPDPAPTKRLTPFASVRLLAV